MPALLLPDLLDRCIAARAEWMDLAHESAFRLLNGFREGLPSLVIDIYGSTAILTNYADPSQDGQPIVAAAQDILKDRLPWLRAGVLKTRNSRSPAERRGILLFGQTPD